MAVIVAAALILSSCGLTATTTVEEESVSEPYVGPTPDQGRSEATEEYAGDSAAIAPVPPDQPGGTGADASTIPPDERYIIRTVGIRIEVDDVEKAVEDVRREVSKVDGMITTVQVSTDEEIPIYRYEATGSLADGAPLRGFLVVRIPPEDVDGFVDAVSGLGRVQRQAEDESDVTQEHIDISARLESLEAQEARLRELFDEAGTIEEMLAVEQELTRVRAEIESLTAQLAYLERQAAMATVTIELASKPAVVSPVGSDWGFVDAITQGIRGLVNTINTVIVVLLSALPLLVLVGIAALGIRWAVRRQHRRDDLAVPHEDTTRDPS
jgi:hypothetical protein